MEYRTQFDGLGDQVSSATAIDFTGVVDMTRQEFQAETDVNYILRRYGVPASPAGEFGEQFQGIDLQEAIKLRRQLDDAWSRLPEPLRREYGNWAQVIQAADQGQLSADDLRAVDEQQNNSVSTEPKHPASTETA